MRKRKGRKRTIGARSPLLVGARTNARWSLGLVHDQMANGRRFRVLNIDDDITRECLAAIPDTSLRRDELARMLGCAGAVPWEEQPAHRLPLQAHNLKVTGSNLAFLPAADY